MKTAIPSGPPGATGSAAAASAVWSVMCDLVLDNERRGEVSDALGLSFGRIKALRRLARRSMSMRELANALGVDPPYATVVIDHLESQHLVRRRSHPTDRRAKIVEVTRKGKALARRADAILGRPPPGLRALDPAELEHLARILQGVAAVPGDHSADRGSQPAGSIG
jgi:DNA-binding MarR family transcriptional regulator